MAVNNVRIAASPTVVFDVLADGWTYSNWVVGTSHMRAVEANWPGVGSHLFHASGPWPVVHRDDTVVDEVERGRRLVLTARARPFGTAKIAIELADDGSGGCDVTMTETPSSGPGLWLHNPAFDALLARRNTEALARLRCLCERHTTPVEDVS
ncbi:MAG: SRPBCC family protein [Jatrophihabitans sp.]